MRHLIVSREYPPAPYPPGGIGTYVTTIARLLAEAGETVHVIAQQWSGAPLATETLVDGRLIVHRVPMDQPYDDSGRLAAEMEAVGPLSRSPYPQQAFAWQAALLAESLVEREGIDVIEGQEWEAPLAYFQLRRALGLGPKQQPPCIVHLHSPTEHIFRYNEWSTARPDYLPTLRLEDYSIGAADGWLCPSRFLARDAERHYGLEDGAISVIPIPVGTTCQLDRDASVWKNGSVCFVGRLEPRKGVVEWVDAAVQVAAEVDDLQFDFVGADLVYMPGVSVQRVMERRIPADMRHRFHFRGSKSRAEVMAHLAQARIGVVPSRWENFPNSCIEMLASGVPVIASPNGGMREMIEDGATGWVAPSATPAGLATALRRAVATSPAELASMGAAASNAVREMCDDAAIVARHLEVRRCVANGGAVRSRHLPPSYPWSRIPRHCALAIPHVPSVPSVRSAREGVAVVVTATIEDAMSSPGFTPALADCLAHVDAQGIPAARRVLLGAATIGRSPEGHALLCQASAGGWIFDDNPTHASDGTIGVVVQRLAEESDILAVAVIDAYDRIASTFVERAESVFRTHAEIGVVTSWADCGDGTWNVEPCPALPFQLLKNGADVAPVFRLEALAAAGGIRDTVDGSHQTWDATNALLAAGWKAVTYPERLVRRVPHDLAGDRIRAHLGAPRARRQLLERVPNALAVAAHELVLHLSFDAVQPPTSTQYVWPSTAASETHVRWALEVLVNAIRKSVRRPRDAAEWVLPRAGRACKRVLARVGRNA